MAEKKIIVRQIGSCIRRNKKQGLYLKSLGLGKIGSSKELVMDRSVEKLIEKVSHIVVVEQR